MGLRVAGNALQDSDPGVRMWAAVGIEQYWMETLDRANADMISVAVRAWWLKRRAAMQGAQER